MLAELDEKTAAPLEGVSTIMTAGRVPLADCVVIVVAAVSTAVPAYGLVVVTVGYEAKEGVSTMTTAGRSPLADWVVTVVAPVIKLLPVYSLVVVIVCKDAGAPDDGVSTMTTAGRVPLAG